MIPALEICGKPRKLRQEAPAPAEPKGGCASSKMRAGIQFSMKCFPHYERRAGLGVPPWLGGWVQSTFCALAILAGFFAAELARGAPGFARESVARMQALPLAARPVIDGEFGPGEWPEETRSEGFFDHETGDPAPDFGEFWLAYDESAIYFAVRFKVNPRGLQANEYRTNVSLSGDENATLQVDVTGGTSEFNSFSVNARGATQINIAGGRAGKIEWLGEIESVGKITETGWQAEARIPWALMRLPSGGVRDLRFNVRWYRTDLQRSYVYRFTNGDATRLPVWAGVNLPDIPTRREIQLLPYGYGGIDDEGKSIMNAGLDLKAELTPQIQFVGSINPDFRNIENQILSLDFSYFERLAGESRPFFLEGSQFIPVGYDQRIFASQRIPSFDLGLKAYGSLGGRTQFGVLSTHDFGKAMAGVAGFSHQITDNSSLSLSAATWDKPGEANTTSRVSYGTRSGNYDVYGYGEFSSDEIQGQGWVGGFGTYYSAAGIESSFDYSEVSPDFFPRIGFAPERDYRGVSGHVQWSRTHPRSKIMETQLEAFGLAFRRFDGSKYRTNAGISTSVTLRDGLDIDTSFSAGEFEQYRDSMFRFSLEKPRRNPYRRWSIDYARGRLEDEDYQSLSLGLTYRPIQRLQTSLRFQSVDHFETRQRLIAAWNLDIGRFESVGGRLVADKEDVGGYLSYRRSGNFGAEYFLIVGDPNSPGFKRNVILKVVVPCSIKF